MTPGDGAEHAGGPPTRGRAADPFGAPHEPDEPPDGSYRVIPLGVPDTPDAYEERKRAAERPESPGFGDAQIDHGDGGSES